MGVEHDWSYGREAWMGWAGTGAITLGWFLESTDQDEKHEGRRGTQVDGIRHRWRKVPEEKQKAAVKIPSHYCSG